MMGRPLITGDDYATDFERLDALSRERALTMPESLRLEECIEQIDKRVYWRRRKRAVAA